jgi:hypothetical protein
MTYSRFTRAALLASVLVASAGCGPDLNSPPAAPTGPSTLSGFLTPQVGGLWGGPLTLEVIGGGTGVLRSAGMIECAGATFEQATNKLNESTLFITQDGAQLSGRLTSAETGLSCRYDGEVTNRNSVTLASTPFSATTATCVAPVLAMICRPDASGRTATALLKIQGSSITGTLSGPEADATISGVASHTYNVHDGEDNIVGGLVATQRFTLRRR